MTEIIQRLLDDSILQVFIIVMFTTLILGFIQYKKAISLEDKLDVSTKFPPLLVSIGMLGTFFGILLALSQFDTRPGALSNAVNGFINGMFTAFASSVVGLSFSLIFRLIISFQDHRAHAVADDKEADVSDLLDKMTEVKDAISKDDDSSLLYQLKSLRTDMNDKLRELKESFDSFKEQMAQNNIKALVEAVNQVMEDFNSKINDKLGETFERLNSSVEKLIIWQDEYKNYLEDAKSRLEEAKLGITQAQENLKNIAASMDTLPEKAKSIETIVTSLGNQINDLESRLAAFKEMKEQALDAMPSIQNNIDNLTSKLESNIEKVTDNISKTTNDLKDSLTKSVSGFEDVSKNINTTIEETTTEIKKSIDLQKTHMTQMTEEVAQNIQKSSESIRENINENLQSIKTLGEDIKDTTDNAVKNLNDRMVEQVTEIDRNIQETHKRVIEEMGKRLSALSEKFVDDYTPLTNKLREIVQISNQVQNNRNP